MCVLRGGRVDPLDRMPRSLAWWGLWRPLHCRAFSRSLSQCAGKIGALSHIFCQKCRFHRRSGRGSSKNGTMAHHRPPDRKEQDSWHPEASSRLHSAPSSGPTPMWCPPRRTRSRSRRSSSSSISMPATAASRPGTSSAGTGSTRTSWETAGSGALSRASAASLPGRRGSRTDAATESTAAETARPRCPRSSRSTICRRRWRICTSASDF